jgi:hypothetical protein
LYQQSGLFSPLRRHEITGESRTQKSQEKREGL